MWRRRLPSRETTPHPRRRVPGSMPSTIMKQGLALRRPRSIGASVSDPDIVVIGSGPNGLVAANVLARHGFRVLVLEAHPRRPGGALGSEELTLPGFLHDVGAGFFPFGRSSPAFQDLGVE